MKKAASKAFKGDFDQCSKSHSARKCSSSVSWVPGTILAPDSRGALARVRFRQITSQWVILAGDKRLK